MVCRLLHHYAQREASVCKAWSLGSVRFEEAEVKVLPDYSRATLQRRSILRPLLEIL